MLADLSKPRLSPSQVAKRAGVNPATVWRWLLRGVRGRRLRSITVGGRRWILLEDLEAFLTDENAVDASTSPQRHHQADIAGILLDAKGVGERSPAARGSNPGGPSIDAPASTSNLLTH